MKGLSYKWIVACVVIFGIFMSVLDTTIVNIAIPRLETAFGAGLTDVDWVVTGYTLAGGVSTPLTPFFSTYLGLKRFYLVILAMFIVSSALCGLAWSLGVLITFRAIQGLSGACMLPMSFTLLYREFAPQERGAAVGALGIPILLAPALGPTLGGYIVTYAGWQLIFYINVPIGIIGFILAAIYLREYRPQEELHFDFIGFILVSVGMVCVLYAFSDAGTDGWGSQKVLSYLIGGIVALIVFVLVEILITRSGGKPLLELRLFKIMSFAGGNVAYIMAIFALYGGLYVVPLYLQDLRGLSAYDSGLLLLPQALGSMTASLVGGRLVDKIGVKPVMIPGMMVLGIALWSFSHLTLNTPYSSFQMLLILRGFGLGLAVQPLSVAILGEIKPAMLSQGSAINSMVRAIASSLAIALVSTLITTQTNVHYARLAEQVVPGSRAATTLHQIALYFQSQGMNQANAMTAAIQTMYNILQQQAYMLSIDDTFLITLVATVIAIFTILFFVRGPQRKAQTTSQKADTASHEAGEAGHEEMHRELVFE
jgi:EmrB/QacA subfamily drug resistance transporter